MIWPMASLRAPPEALLGALHCGHPPDPHASLERAPPRGARGSEEDAEARGREATPPRSSRARGPCPSPFSTLQPHSPHRCVRGPHRALYYRGGHLSPWEGQDWPRSNSPNSLSCHTPRLGRLLPRTAPTTHSKPIKFSILFTSMTPLCRQPRSPPPLHPCPLALYLVWERRRI